ncbi:hypothetical protein RZA67_06775 [Stenotrophomonas sp. C3(2023)]|uniref:hypothetical protein n=1 Tax=Stenotrophomonas sp. C3(2023) TaxID=3080277 RepID=UPI00293C37BD|nr:hypothetical protein [Stenotrophomonas sp. C3(2023)]MDV3468438.1 hypothetical protein [Stenotrophomonas sp. C3(2023)]
MCTERSRSRRHRAALRSAWPQIFRLGLLAMLACAAGCSTVTLGTAGHAGGRWRPVNRYPNATHAIALQTPQTYTVTPLDGTLRVLLQRWADDAGLELVYLPPVDYALHRAASLIGGVGLNDALEQLERAYLGQKLAFAVEGQRLIIRQTSPAGAR